MGARSHHASATGLDKPQKGDASNVSKMVRDVDSRGMSSGVSEKRVTERNFSNVENIGFNKPQRGDASNESKMVRDVDSHRMFLSFTEKRVTRSCLRERNKGSVTDAMKGCSVLRNGSNVSKIVRDVDTLEISWSVAEKRVTRSYTRGRNSGNVEKIGFDKPQKGDVSNVSKMVRDVDSRGIFFSFSEKRVTRSSLRARNSGNVEKIGLDKPWKGDVSNVSKMARDVDPHRIFLGFTEKRVTRSSVRERNKGSVSDTMKGCIVLRKCISIKDLGMESVSEKDVYGGINLSEKCLCKIGKRVTRSASQGVQDKYSLKLQDVKGSSDDGKAKPGANLPGDPICTHEEITAFVPPADLVGRDDRKVVVGAVKKLVGAKRKKTQVDEEHRVVEGWTTEQELALEKAYFATKPTPHFWKKVAKMVPGKFAQECFHKIHSELITPPQPQPRSRVAKATKSSLSLSASKLLTSTVPETKKMKYKKQKSHLSRRTVRQLLQKQYRMGQDSNADLFSVLEQTSDPPTQNFLDGRLLSAPECHSEELCFDKKCVEKSSACRKRLPQLNNSFVAALTSPPVLKKVRNKALHEKYIDQLHSREANRKAASLKARKCANGEIGDKENIVQDMEVIKDAKNALVFCARNAINQFHLLENSKANNFESTFDDFADSSENEIEEVY